MKPKVELQTLSTGHLAPWGDEDIAANNRITGNFPHCFIVPDLPPLPERAVVLDIGAFIGDNTAEFIAKDWIVYAFEPFYDAYLCARLNAPGAIHFNRAVGNGERVVLVNDCPGTNHGMRSVRIDENGEPTLRIDDLGLTQCDFIKIDVEGFEGFVLDGAAETIKKFRPVLYVEAYSEALERYLWNNDMLYQKLNAMNYHCAMIGCPPRWDWLCKPLEKLNETKP